MSPPSAPGPPFARRSSRTRAAARCWRNPRHSPRLREEEQPQTEERTQLRASVAEYVGRLGTAGVPPERMLVLVKAAVHEAAGPAGASTPARALMADVVRWSIAAYYGAA